MNRSTAMIATVVGGLAVGGIGLWRYRAAKHRASHARVSNPRRSVATRAPSPPPPRPLDTPPGAAPPRMFRMDPHHTGRSGFSLPRHPRVLRHFATGARISAQAAVLQDGRIAFGSHDGIVYAIESDTARVAWRFATSDRIYTSPLVSDAGTLYLGSDSDRFYALTARGRLEVGLGTDDDADTSAVLAPDGSIRFASGHTLYATEPDLTVRWRLDFGGKIFSSPAVLDDGTTVVGCQDDAVYAIDPLGVERWHFSTNGDVDATPAVDEHGTIFVGSDDGTLYALDGRDGAVKWRRPLGGYIRAGVAIGLDENLVVGTFGPRTRFVAVDRQEGTERWSIPVAGPPTQDYGIASSALVDRDGRYAVGTPDDELLIVSRSGHVDVQLPMPGDVDSPPVLIADGVLAVGCDDGNLYILGD